MSSIAETLLNSALKGLDFSKLLNAPQVQEAQNLLRQIAEDFKTLKNNQGEILARLDALEKKSDVASAKQSLGYFGPNNGD